MVNIAFIVGKTADVYPLKITSKKAPKWLKQGIKPFMEYVNKDPDDREVNNTVPSDVAMAAYMHYHHPGDGISLIDGSTSKLTQEDLDEEDVIFVIFDAIEVFHCGERKTCPYESQRFERLLKKTTAFVYPHPDFHRYIINKPNYYRDLVRAGIPVAPFFKVTPNAVLKAPSKLKERIMNKGWKGVIVKPSYAGYSLGIKVFKDISRTELSTIRAHFKKLKDKGFPNAVVQEFIPSFAKNYEIRTYWINEQYAFAVATLTEAVGRGGGLPITDFDTFKSEGGTIPDSVLSKLKPVGRKVIKSILQYPIKHPMVRIDFGCCLTIGNCMESYFVNEVETMAANLLAEHTDYPVVERVAQAAYTFAEKVKGKKHIKGRTPRAVPKLKSIPCRLTASAAKKASQKR